MHSNKVAVVGLGYVGLPLACALARHVDVVGIDVDKARIERLRAGGSCAGLTLTSSFDVVADTEFIIIAVPTPVTRSKQPDLTAVREAVASVARHLGRGSVVVLESTVYPGVTQEVVIPLLEQGSGLRCGIDFGVGYCPERINPGDSEHTIERTTKVVSGSDAATLERVAGLYGLIAGDVYRASSLAAAEACKVIENVQRDLNIALVNELSMIFSRLGLDTAEVLDAAATKWNFHRYQPGLVGGHCIPVDPYYLIYRARELGYHPQVISAGRAVNDSMPKYVAEMTVKALNSARKVIRDSRVLVLGMTYKENVPDMRESPSIALIRELQEYGCELAAYDPLVPSESLEGVTLVESLEGIRGVDAIILAVAHDDFRRLSLEDLRRLAAEDAVLVDIRRLYRAADAGAAGFRYLSL